MSTNDASEELDESSKLLDLLLQLSNGNCVDMRCCDKSGRQDTGFRCRPGPTSKPLFLFEHQCGQKGGGNTSSTASTDGEPSLDIGCLDMQKKHCMHLPLPLTFGLFMQTLSSNPVHKDHLHTVA